MDGWVGGWWVDDADIPAHSPSSHPPSNAGSPIPSLLFNQGRRWGCWESDEYCHETGEDGDKKLGQRNIRASPDGEMPVINRVKAALSMAVSVRNT